MYIPSNVNTNCGIYRIKNMRNGKCYIGSSINLQERKATHFRLLKQNKHHSNILQCAFNFETDKSVFEFQIFIYCKKEELVAIEQNCINLMRSEYNSSKIAGRPEHNLEVRKKMSLARKGKPGARTGIPNSPETRAKLSAALKGRISPRKGKKYPDSKPWNKGLEWDKETKDKISKKVKDLWDDPNYRKRLKESHSSHSSSLWKSEDYRKKQTNSAKKSWQKPERRQKQMLTSWKISNMLYQHYWGA